MNSPDALVECVPNFSEGRDRARVDQIVAAMEVDHVHLLDYSLDPDHNRSVVTIAGPPLAVVESAVRGVGRAAELIDLTRQSGEHPRIGAADVVPFVPVQGISIAECAKLARHAGLQIWKRFAIPVYFYGAAAVRPDRLELEMLRRGQFEGLRQAVQQDSSRRPDVGGPLLHSSAGATAVGARQFLIAYNIYLESKSGAPELNRKQADVAVARAIARDLRASSGGLAGVKAIGVTVNGRPQVSINVTDYRRTPISRVQEMVEDLAKRYSCSVAEGELVGLVPQAAIEAGATWMEKIPGFLPEAKILERRLLSPLRWPGFVS